MKKIILASTSPRRRALLEQLGLRFEVDNRIEEKDDVLAGTDPHKVVRDLSLQKARSVAQLYTDAVIIAADTIGVIDGRIIGKPHSKDEARAILSLLSGKAHKVITGFSVIETKTGNTVTDSVETTVYFKTLSEAEIDAYIATGEPLDKAGAYAIQGLGATIVEKIEGDYFNVVGLPLYALAEALREFGVKVL